MRTLVKLVPLHLGIFIFGLISLPFAHGKHAPAEVEVWILEFDDLERMTAENRAKYLIGLRAIIVQFEKSSEDGLVAATHEGFWNEVWNAFKISSAAAVSAADCNSNEVFVPPRSCKIKGLNRARAPGYDCQVVTVDPTATSGNQAYSCQRIVRASTPAPERRAPVDHKPRPGLSPELRPRPVPDQPEITERSESVPTRPLPTTEQPPAEPPAADANCRVKKPSCDNREKYRADFYNKDRRSCVYGGNLSQQLQGTSRSKGRCAPVRTFSVTADDTPKECPKGQIICNPLVFGYSEEPPAAGQPRAPAEQRRFTVPICVPSGREATEKCNRKAPKDNANHMWANSSNGFKDTWNEWKSNLRKMCNEQGEDQAAARFHCKECGIMLERLFALKAEFRGNLCKDLPGYVDSSPVAER